MTARPAAATGARPLLLGEWACLGILAEAPSHGFAIAARLRPTGDIGRVWSLSRALTYRSLDQLLTAGLIRTTGEEPGLAGGNRTILDVSGTGRSQLHTWLSTPVTHLRDLRSELLLKLVIAERCTVDVVPLLDAQRARVVELSEAIDQRVRTHPDDVVALWRSESSHGALRFIDRVSASSR